MRRRRSIQYQRRIVRFRLDFAGPDRRRAVDVELDFEAVGVAEVDRIAVLVFGHAVDLDMAGVEAALERAQLIEPALDAKREMRETDATAVVCRSGRTPLSQRKVVVPLAKRQENHRYTVRSRAPAHTQAQLLVERKRRLYAPHDDDGVTHARDGVCMCHESPPGRSTSKSQHM